MVQPSHNSGVSMKKIAGLALLISLSLGQLHALAGLTVASPFTDNMVLQQGIDLPVWGTAGAGDMVTVLFDQQNAWAKADDKGQWRAIMKALTATPDQQPRDLTITSTDSNHVISRIICSNVLVGEVWLCSGQSNMEFPVNGAKDAAAEMAAATNQTQIRMYTVVKNSQPHPVTTCGGRWEVCTPSTVGGFSAVGYFFARELSRELNVPIGMIHSSWGGTVIEAWMPMTALEKTRAAGERAMAFKEALASYSSDPKEFASKRDAQIQKQNEDMAEWIRSVQAMDIGTQEGWLLGNKGSGSWSATDLPTPPGDFYSCMWCRKTVEIPEAWVGHDLMLNLGSMDEMNTTFVNGKRVGEILDVQQWGTPRHDKVPAALVTNRQLLVAVRILNLYGAIGVGGTAADCSIVPVNATTNDKPLAIATGWERAMGSAIDVTSQPTTLVPADMANLGVDLSTLYNGMIAPLVPYGMRGSLWYQGESNSSQPLEYAELFPEMIQAWREAWGQKAFSFLFVQLANFMERQTQPIEPFSWANVRESQRLTLSVPDTGMASAIDVGDAANIHPTNKQEVGRRLALWALATTYGKTDIVYSGPLYQKATFEGGKAIVTFDHIGVELDAKGGTLVGFAIAGEDKIFHAADAVINGSTVVVSSDKVPAPVAVRYGWASNPVGNLYNFAGLPASPFRTDDWGIRDVQSAPGEVVSGPSEE